MAIISFRMVSNRLFFIQSINWKKSSQERLLRSQVSFNLTFNYSCLVQSGLEYAIKQIKKHKDENPRSNINSTIFLLSNLDSTPAALLTEASARNLAKQLSETGTELFVA
jgi:hypothetical protein